MTREIIINTDSINATKKEALDILKTLEEDINKVEKMIQESQEYFVSQSGNFFREKSVEIINNQKIYIKNSVIPYVRYLDKIIKIYEDTNEHFGKKV